MLSIVILCLLLGEKRWAMAGDFLMNEKSMIDGFLQSLAKNSIFFQKVLNKLFKICPLTIEGARERPTRILSFVNFSN